MRNGIHQKSFCSFSHRKLELENILDNCNNPVMRVLHVCVWGIGREFPLMHHTFKRGLWVKNGPIKRF